VECLGPARHPVEEIELLAELGVDASIGHVAAGGDVDVLEDHALTRAQQFDPYVARLAVVLPVVPGNLSQWNAADRGDAVVALLPVDGAGGVADCLGRGVRELLFAALDLLEAQHVGRLLFEEAGDLIDAQADGIDVTGGYG